MALSFLGKLPRKNPNFQSILTINTRLFTTLNPKPFPDDPTAAYYDDLINNAGRSRDFETVRHLLSKRVRDGCFNTTNTFKFITNTYTSLSILDELSRTLARLDDGFPRKHAYDLLIARLCKLNRTDEALRVVDLMARGGGYGLNACSFHPILRALSRGKKMEDAWKVMDLMRAKEISPDLTAYNYLLTAYCYAGNVTAACEVMKKMDEEGLGADTRTYDALVLGACRAGRVEGALVILRRMVDDGVPALYSTYAHVISGLLNRGYYAQAVEFVMICGGRDEKLDTESFGSLANRLIKLERFNEAKLVLGEMDRRGLRMGDKLMDFYELNFKNKH